jgi:uncharacterized RDD family membrane protein YckC
MSTPPPPEPPGQTPPPQPPSYTPPPPPSQPPSYGPPPVPPSAPPSYPPTAYGQPPTPSLRYAGFWIRFVAVLIDSLIIAIPFVIVAFAVGLALGLGSNGSTSNTNVSSAVSAPLNGLGLVLGFLYYAYFWSTGATPGQRLFGLRVVDAQTMGNISFGKAALRYVGYLVSSWVCTIGLIWAAFDGRKQGWHDKIASTFVIHTT